MSKPTPISGFPEWLPAQRMIEQNVIERIRATFELYGFAPLDTRAVEPLDQLLRKGETSKEVYVLRRLQEDPGAQGDDSLGLHFDLTVPFARFVLENSGRLQFPFRRYQIQKVWRGERPQEGRYREFMQADIDVVDRDNLPFHYDTEMPLVIGDAFASLPIPPVTIQVNNRKVCEGFYRGLGLEDPDQVLRTIDKLDKIGPDKVAALLVETAGATDAQAAACLKLAEISTDDTSFVDAVRALGVDNPLLDEGLAELAGVVDAATEYAPGLVRAELKIARGLDYYTGTVYETQMRGYERFGSICSGGRYENLATSGNERFPGVGISIGGDPDARPALRPQRPRCLAQRADLRRGGAAGRGAAPGLRPDRTGAAPPRHQHRGGAVGGEVRQADPLRRAARHPVRLVPGYGRRGGHDQGHPLGRAGGGGRRHLAGASRGPAPADLRRLTAHLF
nr:hypothetical protein GCM10020092_028860 [Actinoplanes digitatis]